MHIFSILTVVSVAEQAGLSHKPRQKTAYADPESFVRGLVECLIRDRRAVGSSRVVSLSKNINPSLVLVQPRKTRPFITKRFLMGRKESDQTNKSRGIQL